MIIELSHTGVEPLAVNKSGCTSRRHHRQLLGEAEGGKPTSALGTNRSGDRKRGNPENELTTLKQEVIISIP
jgi:hypothetical protein